MDQDLGRVILIGGSGFIGTAIEAELSQINVSVLKIDSKSINLLCQSAEEKLKIVIKRNDVIIMLAALTPDRGRDVDTFTKNIRMIEVVIKVAIDINLSHFIYVSSDAVYGSQAGIISESSTLNPVDLYGAMHMLRELMLNKLLHIPTMILRPTMVYGNGDTHDAYGPNRFLKTSKSNREITLFGKGEELRDYIAVEDVAKIVHLVLMKKCTGILNLATGNSISFRSIADEIIRNEKNLINIRNVNRTNKIFHRHFDITNLIKLFPGYQFRKLGQYLSSKQLINTK